MRSINSNLTGNYDHVNNLEAQLGDDCLRGLWVLNARFGKAQYGTPEYEKMMEEMEKAEEAELERLLALLDEVDDDTDTPAEETPQPSPSLGEKEQEEAPLLVDDTTATAHTQPQPPATEAQHSGESLADIVEEAHESSRYGVIKRTGQNVTTYKKPRSQSRTGQHSAHGESSEDGQLFAMQDIQYPPTGESKKNQEIRAQNQSKPKAIEVWTKHAYSRMKDSVEAIDLKGTGEHSTMVALKPPQDCTPQQFNKLTASLHEYFTVRGVATFGVAEWALGESLPHWHVLASTDNPQAIIDYWLKKCGNSPELRRRHLNACISHVYDDGALTYISKKRTKCGDFNKEARKRYEATGEDWKKIKVWRDNKTLWKRNPKETKTVHKRDADAIRRSAVKLNASRQDDPKTQDKAGKALNTGDLTTSSLQPIQTQIGEDTYTKLCELHIDNGNEIREQEIRAAAQIDLHGKPLPRKPLYEVAKKHPLIKVCRKVRTEINRQKRAARAQDHFLI